MFSHVCLNNDFLDSLEGLACLPLVQALLAFVYCLLYKLGMSSPNEFLDSTFSSTDNLKDCLIALAFNKVEDPSISNGDKFVILFAHTADTIVDNCTNEQCYQFHI